MSTLFKQPPDILKGKASSTPADILGGKFSNAPPDLLRNTSGPVMSVFGRTGYVIAQAGDYTADLITNAVDQTGRYANPVWITSLDWSKILNAPAIPSVAAYQTPWLQDINAAGFRLLNAANLGIGTSTPLNPLHVVGNPGWSDFPPQPGYGWAYFANSDGSASMSFGGNGSWGSGEGASWIQASIPNSTQLGNLILQPQRGNVGINQVMPAYQLDVQGDVNTSGRYLQNGSPLPGQSPWTQDVDAAGHNLSNAYTVSAAILFASNRVEVQGAAADPATNVDKGIVRITGTTTARLEIGTLAGFPYGMWLQTKDSQNTGSTYPLLLNPLGGPVGIGTSNPLAQLDLSGSVNGDTPGQNLKQCFSAGGTPLFGWRLDSGNGSLILDRAYGDWASVPALRILRSNGFIGVNNDNPQYQLDVGGRARFLGDVTLSGSDLNDARIVQANTVNATTQYLINGVPLVSSGGSNTFLWSQTGGRLAVINGTGNSALLTILDSGNVGIGQSNPGYPLDVIGNVNCTGQYLINGVPISSGGGSQSPWLSDIDAAGHSLNNANTIGTKQQYLYGSSSSPAILGFYYAGVARWLTLAAGTESGSNTGSDFEIARFDDGGTLQDISLAINRATGRVTLSNTLTVGGAGLTMTSPYGASGGGGAITWGTGASERWQMTTWSPETGSNAGSDFIVSAFNDSGAWLLTPLTITRATGKVMLGNALTAGGVIESTSGGIKFPDGTVQITAATGGSFATGVIPTGSIDGTNQAFTLPQTPNPASSLRLTVNGVLQRPADFALAGATITYTIPPHVNDSMRADYSY